MRRGLALALAVAFMIGVAAWLLAPATPPPDDIALTSVAITLPVETEALPAGPHVDLVTSRCTACHSAAMITAQPPLSADQWKATVTKMREVYRAPVPKEEEPLILAYLETLGR